MSNPNVMTEEDLLLDTGFGRRGDLRRWLDVHHIPYRVGRGGRICGVTIDAYSAAANDHDDLEFADGP